MRHEQQRRLRRRRLRQLRLCQLQRAPIAVNRRVTWSSSHMLHRCLRMCILNRIMLQRKYIYLSTVARRAKLSGFNSPGIKHFHGCTTKRTSKEYSVSTVRSHMTQTVLSLYRKMQTSLFPLMDFVIGKKQLRNSKYTSHLTLTPQQCSAIRLLRLPSLCNCLCITDSSRSNRETAC